MVARAKRDLGAQIFDDLEFGIIALEAGGALWLGNDSELGHTFWQTIDASVISGVTAEALNAFSRARPDRGNNPNR